MKAARGQEKLRDRFAATNRVHSMPAQHPVPYRFVSPGDGQRPFLLVELSSQAAAGVIHRLNGRRRSNIEDHAPPTREIGTGRNLPSLDLKTVDAPDAVERRATSRSGEGPQILTDLSNR